MPRRRATKAERSLPNSPQPSPRSSKAQPVAASAEREPVAAQPEEEDETLTAEEEEEAEKKEAEEAAAVAPSDEKRAKPAIKTYHIAKRKSDNKWQVKAAGGAKAIKLFFTQAEAIEFAKKLAESQEARIVIHKEDGTFRRLTYRK